jgi:hypothetical protein
MADDRYADEPRPWYSRPMTLGIAAVGILAAASTFLPESLRPWNFAAIGAVALFAAARLGFLPALAIVAVALVVKDLGMYVRHGFEPYPLSWVFFAGYAAIGWLFLRKTESPVAIGLAALSASIVFFLASNFVSWLEQAYPYGYSFAGLLDCYSAAIPFYRGTITGDLLYSGAFFGLHAALSRAYFPAERVAVVEEVRDSEHGA